MEVQYTKIQNGLKKEKQKTENRISLGSESVGNYLETQSFFDALNTAQEVS